MREIPRVKKLIFFLKKKYSKICIKFNFLSENR